MKSSKFTWRQIENSIVYDTFYQLDYLVHVYEQKVEREKIVKDNKKRYRTKEEKEKKYQELSNLLIERYKYNPENLSSKDLKGGENTKFTNKKLIISGNIVELYKYNKNLNYDYKSLSFSEKKSAYEGLEQEELIEAIERNRIKSRRRTLVNYKRLVNANIDSFKRFFTGTFAPILEPYHGAFQDLEFTNNEYKEFIKRVKRFFKEFYNKELDLKYIATIEPQKESTWNFHYHVLMNLPFLENRPHKLTDREKEFLKNKINYIKEKIEKNKKVYDYELRVLKLWNYRKESFENQGKKFEGIGLLDYLWSWGSVDYKSIYYKKDKEKDGFKSEKSKNGQVDMYQQGLDIGSYMAKNISDYMIKNLKEDGPEGEKFFDMIENKRLYLYSRNLEKPKVLMNEIEIDEYVEKNLDDSKFVYSVEFDSEFISGTIEKYNLNGVIKKKKKQNNKKKIVINSYDTKNLFIMKDELLYRSGTEFVKVKESDFENILKLNIKDDIRQYITELQYINK